MDIDRLLEPRHAFCGLAASGKKQLLRAIADEAAPLLNLDSNHIFEALLQRERLGTTGLGQGIAIPHARLDGVDTIKAFLFKTSAPVDFEAVDDKPIDLLFVIFAPGDAGSDHLNALVVASRLLRDPQMTRDLRATQDSATLHAVATRPAAQQNAA